MRKKDFWLILTAVAAALLLAAGQFASRALPTVAWGLSFPSAGAAPNGPADSETLRKYDAAYVGDGSDKVLYLTFDAGYENGCTEQVLDTLKAHGVKAAFFLVGNYLEKNADLVRRMVDEGHVVGNHTMTHPDMSAITDPSVFRAELEGLETLFREITGKDLPKYYRPPQGVCSEENLKMAQALGYKTVFWSLAYKDWDNDRQPTADYALGKLVPRTHNGAVILLHSTSQTNAQVLDELLTQWEDLGYRFETIDQLFP